MGDKQVSADVLVRFRFDNICNREDLDECTLGQMVTSLIESEGLFGVVNDEFEIVEIKGCPDA